MKNPTSWTENADTIEALKASNAELLAALRDLIGVSAEIRRGFGKENPYRKHSESYDNWNSSVAKNANLFDAAEERARAVIKKAAS